MAFHILPIPLQYRVFSEVKWKVSWPRPATRLTGSAPKTQTGTQYGLASRSSYLEKWIASLKTPCEYKYIQDTAYRLKLKSLKAISDSPLTPTQVAL